MGYKVKVRKKPISGDRNSLYLDIYPATIHPETGKLTRREFLGLYIFDNPKSPVDKLHNKETLQIAQQIRQKRDSLLNKPEIYSGYEKEQLRIKKLGEEDFVLYFKKLAHKRKASNHDNWISAYHYLSNFTDGSLRFDSLNEKFCNDFKDYLLTTKSRKSTKTKLAQNSALSYFNKFKASLKQAFKDGYLQHDLNGRISPIKEKETRRNFLTLEELNSLVKTPCESEILRNAALFSALTGLRFSDIKNLLWSHVEFIEGNGYFLNFEQQKTKGVENLPISEQAFSLLGQERHSTQSIFEGLTYSAALNKELASWIKLAGIKKKITFHCFRHTYATLQLSSGTDIYTVSKMLGHRDLKTTQIYAKIINETKRDAADKIKLDF